MEQEWNLTLITDIKEGNIKIPLSVSIADDFLGYDRSSYRNESIVFADHAYDFSLSGERVHDISDIDFFVNDVRIPVSFLQDGAIRVPSSFNYSSRYVFREFFGFVQIIIRVKFFDDSEIELVSKYLSVLVRKQSGYKSIKEMIAYVYSTDAISCIHGAQVNRVSGDFSSGNIRTIFSLIELINKVISVYERHYGYFQANCRNKITKEMVVDSIEKVQYIDNNSIQYIVRHPEMLSQSISSSGMKFANNYYQPKKILAVRNNKTNDIYENRVILGFIDHVFHSIDYLVKQVKTRIGQIPSDEEYSNDYIYSSFLMLEESRKTLTESIDILNKQKRKLDELRKIYQSAVDVPLEDFNSFPRPTHIFLSVPQYNEIFLLVDKWFRFGNYSFSREDFFLSLIQISALYEIYILARIINHLTECGYILQSSEYYKYPVSTRALYRQNKNTNTFTFVREKSELKVYYQPVIYNSDKKHLNGIGLYRNNSLTQAKDYDGGAYYVPDFVLKLSDNNINTYIIIDAKYSELKTVKTYYASEIAFKYIFSLSPIEDNDYIKAVMIMYGKNIEGAYVANLYDKQLEGSKIEPCFVAVPFQENLSITEKKDQLGFILSHLSYSKRQK